MDFPISIPLPSLDSFSLKGISDKISSISSHVRCAISSFFGFSQDVKRIRELASCKRENFKTTWKEADLQVVKEGFVKLAKEGVLRKIRLKSCLNRIAQLLFQEDKQKLHQLLDEVVKESFEKELPKIADTFFSFFSFQEMQELIKINIPGAKSIDELLDEHLLGSEFLISDEHQVKTRDRLRSIVRNFLPNLVDLLVKAFSLMDTGKVFSIWEISYLLAVIGGIISIPVALIKFLLPIVNTASTAYLITGGIVLIALAGVFAYIKWFKPIPHRIHDNFTNMNEEVWSFEPIVGREEECMQILTRIIDQKKGRGRHILVYGESGVGKTSTLQSVITKVVKNEVDDPLLKGCVFFSTSTASLEANSSFEGFAAILNAVIYRLLGYEKQVVLILSEFHVAEKSTLRDFFLDFLDRIGMTVIAVTSKKDFDVALKKDSELLRRFTLLLLEATDKLVTGQILQRFSKAKASDLILEEGVIETILNTSFEYFKELQPSKAKEDIDDLFNKMHESLKDLKEEKEYQDLKIDLTTHLQRFHEHFSGVQKSEEGKRLKESIVEKQKVVETKFEELKKKRQQIELLRHLISKQTRLNASVRKKALMVKTAKNIHQSHLLKKQILAIDAYLVRNLELLIGTKEEEVKPFAKVRIDTKTAEDFLKQKYQAVWSFQNPISLMPIEKILRIETVAKAQVKWTKDNWQTHVELLMQQQVDGKHFIQLPTQTLASGSEVQFTFHWIDANHWEGGNRTVLIS